MPGPRAGPGMLVPMQQSEHPPTRAQNSRIAVPSREDTLLRASTEPIGGPLGWHAGPGRQRAGFFTVERVLVLAVLAAAVIAVLFKDHCRRAGWITPDQYSTACYSALPNDFEGFLVASSFPEALGSLNASPLAAYLTSFTAWLSGMLSGEEEGSAGTLAYFDTAVVLIVLAWVLAVLAMAWLNRRRPWDAAVLAVSPLLLFAAYTDWQLWAVALLLTGLLFFARGLPLLAGLLFGAAGAVQPVLLLIPVALIVLAVRRREHIRALFSRLIPGAVISWSGLGLTVQLLAPQVWPGGYLMRVWADDPSAGSWFGVINAFARRFGLTELSGSTASLISLALLLAGAIFILWMFFRLKRPMRVAQLCFLLVAWALLVDKNAVPENLVLLLPLLALARPRWRLLLGWQFAALVFYLAYLLYQGVVLGTNNTQNGIDLPYYALAMLVVTAGTIIAGGQVFWDAMHPRSDPVRRRGPDPLWPGKLRGQDLRRGRAASVPD
ncbi:glycosyltransferase 87 family protein [Acaricomes phytoseiuli]|uniref:glycosyltransferase 87 family protein n=1 Tax=Acaricomes phytoseiuli TaxID=291968 RepID=UPI0012EA144C|nr:glycosyltransferase 87 family protein [Acaricomes phytoseiuli]